MEDIYAKTSSLNDSLFKQLIGVKRSTFTHMLEILNKAYQAEHLTGGRPRCLSLENQLLLTLRYWRHYPTQRLIAFDFDVPLSCVSRTITWVENTLHEEGSFDIEGVKDKDHWFAIDVTESPIQRPKKPT
ncbi:hypothetical protein Hs30E_11470 [Lactococcus hodotermopsidis]|uniref:Transposase Helix-turn-helix domain-containing protein n=1 Tax=Pseudolactococcus hodotermopsidis TaxID=2709157 RepID=A0A6A0BCM0_9LACT|nr:transposase family protein [Lactococcus hodotermopsidis]GFH42596.1 hypothetical protein Hs30E_11470 [Lactococcus hodotermopsidis]